MKTSIRCQFALLTACAALPVSGLRAQAPAAAATPSVSAPAKSAAAGEGDEREGGMREALAALTPEERQKLGAARRAAMQDPAVKAAEATRATDKRGYRRTVRAAMLKADPSIGPIFEKMRDAHPHRKNI